MFLNKLRENTQVIAMLVAVGLALAAQYYFTGEIFTHQRNSNTWDWTTKYSLALVLLLLAIGFAVWAAFPRHKVDEFLPQPLIPLANQRRVWLIGAGLSYLLSVVLYVAMGENSWVRLFWILGVGLLLVPFWMQTRGRPSVSRIPTWEWLAVVVIVMIGFGLRYWKLTEIPSHVDNDVALMGTYGIELIQSNNYNWIGYSESQHLLSYDQFQAWGMRLFGQNHYGIVMHSVILGTLSLVFVYLLGREIGGPLVGFMSAGLLMISYTHIHFSRILFGNSASFAAILTVYAIFKGLRTRQPLWFALGGVFTGWGLLLYDSSRIIPFLLLVLVAVQWFWYRQWLKSMYKDWVVFFAGILLAFGPMLAYAILNFSDFAGRANMVVLWSDIVWEHELASYQTTSPFVVLVQQIWRTFLTLHLTGDASPHFAFQRPMVSPLTALLFVLGLGYVSSRLKNIKYFTLLGWIFLTFVFGGVLTSDPPYWPHLNIALPAIVLIASLGAQSIAEKIIMLFGQIGYKVYVWILVGLILVTGLNNWQVYYDYVKNNAGNRIRIARYLTSLPANYYVYLASDAFNWQEHSFRFFSRGTKGEDLKLETLENNPPVLEQPTVFILFRHPEMVPILQQLYPDGELQNHYDFDNLVSFISYRVVPSTADIAPQPLEVSSLSSTGWQLVFGLIVLWMGYIAYNHYASREDVEVDQAGGGRSIRRRQRLVSLNNKYRNDRHTYRISRQPVSIIEDETEK